MHHHPRRRARQLPHAARPPRTSRRCGGDSGWTGCPRSASATGRPRWPAGPGCSRRPSAGWCSTGRRTRRSTSRRSASPGPAAAETAFNAFAVACTAQPACPLGPDPRATVTSILSRLHLRPQAAVDGRRLTAGRAVAALLAGLGQPAGWPALAGALAAVDRGEPDPLLDLLEPVAGSGGRFDAMLATSCNDTRRRLAPSEVADLYGRWRSSYPIFGGTHGAAPAGLRALADRRPAAARRTGRGRAADPGHRGRRRSAQPGRRGPQHRRQPGLRPVPELAGRRHRCLSAHGVRAQRRRRSI